MCVCVCASIANEQECDGNTKQYTKKKCTQKHSVRIESQQMCIGTCIQTCIQYEPTCIHLHAKRCINVNETFDVQMKMVEQQRERERQSNWANRECKSEKETVTIFSESESEFVFRNCHRHSERFRHFRKYNVTTPVVAYLCRRNDFVQSMQTKHTNTHRKNIKQIRCLVVSDRIEEKKIVNRSFILIINQHLTN